MKVSVALTCEAKSAAEVMLSRSTRVLDWIMRMMAALSCSSAAVADDTPADDEQLAKTQLKADEEEDDVEGSVVTDIIM